MYARDVIFTVRKSLMCPIDAARDGVVVIVYRHLYNTVVMHLRLAVPNECCAGPERRSRSDEMVLLYTQSSGGSRAPVK